jgi:hypothetical protein
MREANDRSVHSSCKVEADLILKDQTQRNQLNALIRVQSILERFQHSNIEQSDVHDHGFESFDNTERIVMFAKGTLSLQKGSRGIILKQDAGENRQPHTSLYAFRQMGNRLHRI